MAAELVAAQTARWTGIDPALPPATAPPDGDVATAALPDGSRVAGITSYVSYPPGSANLLWSTAQVWELVPLLGVAGGAGMDAMLRVWRERLARVLSPDPDSACVLSWPSRDAEATRALLDHGFVPLSVLAVRRPGSEPPEVRPELSVRRATIADLEAIVELAVVELEYSALVGAAMVRPQAVELKRRAMAKRLRAGEPVWLAERDGVTLGMVECGWIDAAAGSAAATRLPAGRWGYVNCASVLPGARGNGVGRRLMATVHAEFHRAGAAGTYLYYNPPNPLSSVFWARLGYRPLWTMWEVRPANALR